MIVIQGNLKKTSAYTELGLNEGASIKEIKKAYKKLVLKYHPDKFSDPKAQEDAQEKFIKIQKAYEVLSEKDKKKPYGVSEFKDIFTFYKVINENEKQTINFLTEGLTVNPTVTSSHICAAKINFARKNVHLCNNHKELDGANVWRIPNIELTKTLELFIIGGGLSFTNNRGNNIPTANYLTIGALKPSIFSKGHDFMLDNYGKYKVKGKTADSVKDFHERRSGADSSYFAERKEPHILKEALKKSSDEEIVEVITVGNEEFYTVNIPGNVFTYEKLFAALNPKNIKAPEGFNPLLYWIANPDVKAQLLSPEIHYVQIGMKEGRDAGIQFKENDYLSTNSHVKKEIEDGGYINGFEHFSKKGCFEGLSPDGKFDVKKYLNKESWRNETPKNDQDEEANESMNGNENKQSEKYDQCYFFKCINEAMTLVGSNEVHYCKDLYFDGANQ